MRVLGSSVLIFETIIVILAIPVAVFGRNEPSGPMLAGGLVLALLCVAGVGVLGRPWGVWFGWAVQGLIVLTGVLVPLMFVVGGLFAMLWFFAIRFGRRAEAIRAEHEAAARAEAEPSAAERAPADRATAGS